MKKKFLSLIPVVLFVIYFLFQYRRSTKKHELFFKFPISNKIKEVRLDGFSGKGYNYSFTGSNVVLYLRKGYPLKVGDSVVKDSNSYIFDVYRKSIDSNNYQSLRTVNYKTYMSEEEWAN